MDDTDHANIAICQGPPRCSGKPEPCEWCYWTASDDPRTAEEIVEDMKRMH